MHRLLFSIMLMGSSLSAQTPSFVPGQILLKFADGTNGYQATVAASRANRVDMDALKNEVAALSARVGMPLEATSIGSGYWVVLSLDTVALGQRLGNWLQGRSGVTTLDQRASDQAFVLSLSGESPVAEATRAALAGRTEPLRRLMDSWSVEAGVPIVGQATDSTDLAVRVDLAQATLDVVSNLKALPDVASVQPNYAQRRSHST